MDAKLTINSGFIGEIKSLIESSKQNIAISVNAEMTLLYWQILQKNYYTRLGKSFILRLLFMSTILRHYILSACD